MHFILNTMTTQAVNSWTPHTHRLTHTGSYNTSLHRMHSVSGWSNRSYRLKCTNKPPSSSFKPLPHLQTTTDSYAQQTVYMYMYIVEWSTLHIHGLWPVALKFQLRSSKTIHVRRLNHNESIGECTCTYMYISIGNSVMLQCTVHYRTYVHVCTRGLLLKQYPIRAYFVHMLLYKGYVLLILYILTDHSIVPIHQLILHV